MNFFKNEFDPDNKEITKKVKQWVKTYFGLHDVSCVVLVSELKCADEGCLDIETVISILMQPEIKVYKIGKPLMYVRVHDIELISEQYLLYNN
ncbi:MAG: nitrate reductase [Bacteroidetes bacterium]|nr:nitrate reductase [Bacteroidota bacterium]